MGIDEWLRCLSAQYTTDRLAPCISDRTGYDIYKFSKLLKPIIFLSMHVFWIKTEMALICPGAWILHRHDEIYAQYM